jgi:hypothetical protein
MFLEDGLSQVKDLELYMVQSRIAYHLLHINFVIYISKVLGSPDKEHNQDR